MLPQGIWPFSYLRYKRIQKEIAASQFGEVSDVHFESCACPMQCLILVYVLHTHLTFFAWVSVFVRDCARVCASVCVLARTLLVLQLCLKIATVCIATLIKRWCVHMHMTEWGMFPQSGFAVWLHYHVCFYSYWVLGCFQAYWHSYKLRRL